jgi:type I restriction enzyme S subunit
VKAGWKLQRLGDLCAFDKSQGIHTNLPYVGLEHIESDTGQYLGNLEPTDVKSSTFKFNDSHVLYGRLRPYLNKVLLPDFEGHCSTEIFPIQIKPGLLREYLGHWLMSESVVESINTTCTGARMPRADMNAVLEFNIPVPSEQEQRRIVTLLDEAFADIATANANAEKNLQNARELLDNHLEKTFATISPDWKKETLQSLCEKITDGTHQTPTYFESGVIFLSSRNVTSGEIDWENIKYIDERQHLEMHRRVAPRVGDILLAKNGTTGVAAMVDKDEVFDIYVSLALIRSLGAIHPKLLLHFINSPAAKKQFNKRLKGTGVPNLHLEEIRQVEVNFPISHAAQDRLVMDIEVFKREVQRLEAIYRQKLTALDDLKKSLLNQAFSGQL